MSLTMNLDAARIVDWFSSNRGCVVMAVDRLWSDKMFRRNLAERRAQLIAGRDRLVRDHEVFFLVLSELNEIAKRSIEVADRKNELARSRSASRPNDGKDDARARLAAEVAEFERRAA